jgi:2-polyprenyl-6-hydroxyphenyl methylase/3-demethylubiquinone-9 3-methyltransferase
LTARRLPRQLRHAESDAGFGRAGALQICGEPAPLYGTVDFNRNCEIEGGIKLPPSGTPVRCRGCGFLFTDAFDRWSHDDFRTHIYNDGYAAVDPEYAEARPRNNATAVLALFGAHKDGRRVLDYGGGNDAFCSHLRAAGFRLAVTYDPFVPDFASPPAGKYDLITCFETIEHMPDPVAGIGDIVALWTSRAGLFSTMLQPRIRLRDELVVCRPPTGTFRCSPSSRRAWGRRATDRVVR